MCETTAFTGVALSTGVLEGLASRGMRIVQCRWRYGDGLRPGGPFPPHLALAGAFTTVDGRAGSGFDGFGGWFPHDHDGCLCSLVPVFA